MTKTSDISILSKKETFLKKRTKKYFIKIRFSSHRFDFIFWEIKISHRIASHFYFPQGVDSIRFALLFEKINVVASIRFASRKKVRSPNTDSGVSYLLESIQDTKTGFVWSTSYCFLFISCSSKKITPSEYELNNFLTNQRP